MKKCDCLEIGEIFNVFGVKGEVKLRIWCDSFQFFSKFDRLFFSCDGKEAKKVEKVRAHKGYAIVKFGDVCSIGEAEKLVGLKVYCCRDDVDLEEGSCFVQDLLGLEVYDFFDRELCYGKIVEVLKTGANDVYRVLDEHKVERLVPAIEEVVVEKNFEKGYIVIKPLVGLFDV